MGSEGLAWIGGEPKRERQVRGKESKRNSLLSKGMKVDTRFIKHATRRYLNGGEQKEP